MHNYTIKKAKIALKKVTLGFLMLFGVWNSITAKPYLKIQQIRSLNYPYIKAEVSVSRLTPILNLSESNFEVFENGWKVANFQLKSFRHLSEPKNIIIAVDGSNSLSKKAFKKQLEAARKFASQLAPHDKMAVYSFHNKVERHCGFTSATQQMKECISAIKQHGKKTLLYDTILDAASMASKLKDQRKFMVVFTDGRDEGSTMTMNDTISYLMRHSIPVFVIATGNKKRIKKLTRITNMTGGETYYTSTNSDLKRVYQLLNHILDSNYLVQYVSHGLVTSEKNGKIDLEVRLNAGSLKDQDHYTFNVSPEVQGNWFEKIWHNERYLLFIAGLLLIIILLILALFVMRKPEVNVEIPEKFILANENQNKLIANLSDENKNSEISGSNIKADLPMKNNFRSPYEEITLSEEEVIKYNKVWLVEESIYHPKKYILKNDITTLGSNSNNFIELNDSRVSFKHAEIRKKGEKYYLFDLLSQSGVYLNDKKLLRPKSLNDFDQIEIGDTVLTFRVEVA